MAGKAALGATALGFNIAGKTTAGSDGSCPKSLKWTPACSKASAGADAKEQAATAADQAAEQQKEKMGAMEKIVPFSISGSLSSSSMSCCFCIMIMVMMTMSKK
mgnify:CR=1 FL=1